MADDKNLATLKVTVTADKSPLKKALDSAKKDTEKSTSQIQRILQKIRKTMSSVSLKGMVKDFQVKSGIKVPTQEFQELREEAGKARDALADLLEKQKKLEALGVKEQSREWKSLQYDIEKAKNAVEGYKAEMSEMKANTQQKVKMESSWLRTGSIPLRTKRALQKTWMSSWRLRQRLASILFLRKRLRNVTIHVMMP